MEIKDYNEITVSEMKKILQDDFDIELDEIDKKTVYEAYKKAIQGSEKETLEVEETVKEVVEEVVEEEPSAVEKLVQGNKTEQVQVTDRPRDIDPAELIPVRSESLCGITYISPRTKFKTTWYEYGDVQTLEFSELMTMKATNRKFLETPFLIVEDIDAVKKLGLMHIYENVKTREDIERLLKLPLDDLGVELAKVEKKQVATKDLIIDVSKKLIKEKELTDVWKIKMIEETFGVDLAV